MKKNNKYRGNNNNYSNQVYSLNYKFDSISVAGKISGTALDLIKRYNELAKEAHGNADYIEAEVFRQYAEHYRKIVTDINERKNLQQKAANQVRENENGEIVNNNDKVAIGASISPAVTDEAGEAVKLNENHSSEAAELVAAPKREFKVIEISHADAKAELIAGKDNNETKAPKTRSPRTLRRKVSAETTAAL